MGTGAMAGGPNTTGAGPAIRVGIAFGFGPEDLALFRSISPRVELRVGGGTDQAAIDEIAATDLDAIIGRGLPTDRSRTPSLRWVQVLSAGVEQLVLDGPTWPAEVVLTNARGAYATSIAQYTIGAILRIAERVDLRRTFQAEARWSDESETESLGRQVRGRTLLIVGYGGVGREIARLAAAHGLRVLAVKANPAVLADDSYRVPGTGDPDGVIPERIVGIERLRDIAAEADYVSVTLPLTTATRGVVGEGVLAALGPDTWIINTGRGPVIDEAALAAALTAGRIGGAVLDVFGEEPLPPTSPFWRLPNAVVTPHVSGASSEVLAGLVAENLRRFVAGEPLIHRVDPLRGY